MGRVHNTKGKAFKAKGPGASRPNWHGRRNPYNARGRKSAMMARRHLTDQEYGEWLQHNYVVAL